MHPLPPIHPPTIPSLSHFDFHIKREMEQIWNISFSIFREGGGEFCYFLLEILGCYYNNQLLGKMIDL